MKLEDKMLLSCMLAIDKSKKCPPQLGITTQYRNRASPIASLSFYSPAAELAMGQGVSVKYMRRPSTPISRKPASLLTRAYNFKATRPYPNIYPIG